ncbi:MAG: ThiF family adenylyltransferase [Deltaproteobacteria bacterium]|nr:ThiF family adenylyltransferase [Deltaproteobacteria bacterium]
MVREKSRIDAAFPDNDFTFEIKDDELWITGTILGFFEFECKYPPSYPSGPPDIFPKNRSSKWVLRHQYVKEGRFCLDIREKTWCSRMTAADIIKSVQTLLIAEGIRKITKSDKLIVYEEPEPIRIDCLLRQKRCVLPSDLSFPEDQNYGRLNYVYKLNSETHRLIITDIFEGESKRESTLAKQIWLADTLRTKYKGLWVRVNKDQFIELLLIDEAQEALKRLSSYAAFSEDLNFKEYSVKGSYGKFLVLTSEYPHLPFLLDYNSEKQSISRYGVYVFYINHLIARMPSKENYEFLSRKKVAIIGCGAGGSKDAEYLVKSGVGKIVLIDDDTLQTENILRHSCQLDDLSIEKVYAVKDKLKKINPYVKVQPLRKNLDIIDAKTDELIRDSDLIIVATAANEELINEYAFPRGIPAIYSKVYPMGFGGEIIRIIPGLTPCFECSHYFKEALLQEYKPEAKFPAMHSASYDTLSDGTYVPIPALAVDSDFISLIGVKMALEVLIENDPKALIGSSHIRLWGNKKEWVFDQGYQCISIENDKVKSFPNCIVCYGDSVIEKELGKDQAQVDDEYTEILSKIKGAIGDDKDSDG